jgi:hypothetical protein
VPGLPAVSQAVATCARRRLETPARTGSPSFRVRKKNCTWNPRLSGNVLRGTIVSVTKPDWFVTCSGGVEVTSGVERANTSAPRTTKPLVSETCTRSATGPRREVTTPGTKWTLSITRRFGSETLVTGIEVLPLARRICPSGPVVVVVGVVVLVELVEVEVDVLVDVEDDVELLVESVDVEPVVLDVVVSASGLNAPAAPALAM